MMNKKYKFIFLAVVILGIITATTLYLRTVSIPVLQPRGPIGEKERNLIFFALGLSLIVVIPVFVLLFTFAWKYREGNPKRVKYSPDLEGNRIAETIWWLIPTALICVLSVVAWNSSHTLDPFKPIASKTPQMTIQVVSLNWKWLFIYPDQHIATVNFVQFPKNTPIDFEITSDTVMNSFWIPQLGGQIYAMPGMITQLHLMASSDGNFNGSSANISGNGFAGMSFVAKASSEISFNQWVQSVKHTPNNLSLAAYNKLAEPSENNKVSYYSSEQQNLYDTIVMKYMTPQTNSAPQPTKGTNSTSMQGMAM